MADKYLLRVTAGPSHDPSTHKVVAVNTPDLTNISSPLADISLAVRIQNYRGLPPSSPHTSPYFYHPPHTSDQYSISFTFTPKTSIPGPSLLFGNDFDLPVRDRLPPGFNAAFRIVKWTIDPGMEGDIYADKPYLFSPALGSMNVLRVGGKQDEGGEPINLNGERSNNNENEDGGAGRGGAGSLSEGSQSSGTSQRSSSGMPASSSDRKRWALKEGRNPESWTWEAHRQYAFDFFNPYLDFNNFALKIPGFSLSLVGYLGKNDYLRYVLKNKENGEVFFVVVFTLLKKEEMEERVVKEVEGRHEGVVVSGDSRKEGEEEKEDEGDKKGRGAGGGDETRPDDVD